MLSWYTALGYGALGGLIVEVIAVWHQLRAWQEERRAAIGAGMAGPKLFGRFIDLGPDVAVALSRVILGCGAGWLLHAEVTGAYAAVAVGASAPAFLSHLGRASAENLESASADGIRNAEPEVSA